MRIGRSLTLLAVYAAACLLVPQTVQAQADRNAEIIGAEFAEDSEAVSEKLEAFIKSAVESGLLQSSDPEYAVGPDGQIILEPVVNCAGLDALKFGDFTLLETYEELIEFRKLLAKSKKVNRLEAGLLLTKAYISLGLESEATLKLRGLQGETADVLEELVDLIEGESEALMTRLTDKATCGPEARFWYGVALLDTDPEQGGDLFSQGIAVFRTLPFQLQANIAAQSIPIIERAGNKLLVQKIMASFTAEQIEFSSKLQFSQALMDISLGQDANIRLVESFLEKPSTSDAAMSAILSQNEQPFLINETTRFSEALEFIQSARGKHAAATRLHVVINAFLEGQRYDEIRRLSEVPTLSNPQFQEAIAHVLTKYVSINLRDDALQNKILAINFLLDDNGLLKADRSGRKLMQEAITVARENGFEVLSNLLLEKLDQRKEARPALAHQAYRRQDYATVYSLAEAQSASAELAYYAGLSAIAQGDAGRLQRYEGQLLSAPEHLIGLIEADVLAETWLVSDAAYLAVAGALAEAPPETADVRRFQRVSLIKDQRRISQSPNAPDYADISRMLETNRSRTGLNEGSDS